MAPRDAPNSLVETTRSALTGKAVWVAEAGPQPFRQDVQNARLLHPSRTGMWFREQVVQPEEGGPLTADRSGSKCALKVRLKSVWWPRLDSEVVRAGVDTPR